MSWQAFILATLLLSCALTPGTPSTWLRVEGGAYRGVVVAFADTISEDEAIEVIHKIKSLLTESSQFLYEATFRQLYIGEVIILVPETWTNISGLITGNDTYGNFEEAEVRIEEPNPAYGDNPYTQQPRGCGEPGDFIHLTPTFLLSLGKSSMSMSDAAKRFIHEWVHLRFGVFDESGVLHRLKDLSLYEDEPRYPLLYQDGDQLKPSGCAGWNLNGIWHGVCEKNAATGLYGKDCKYEFKPPKEETKNVTHASLMDLSLHPYVSRFCDNKSHNALAPTKHNVLCRSRSTWDVIQSGPDIAGSTGLRIPPVNLRPQIVVHQAQRPQHCILVIDESSFMNHFERFELVNNAVIRLLKYYLPDGVTVGVVTFARRALIRRHLTPLNSTTRDILSNGIPLNPKNENEANLYAALDVAILLLEPSIVGAVCVVISSGANSHSFIENLSLLSLRMRRHSVRVIAVTHPLTAQVTDTLKAMKTLASETGGLAVVVHEWGAGQRSHASSLDQLDTAMMAAAEIIEPNVIQIYRQSSMNTKPFEGSFYVEESLGSELFFSVTYYKRRFVNSVKLLSPSSKLYDDASIHYEDTGDRTRWFIFKFHAAEKGRWNFSINAESFDHQPVIVAVTSEVSNGQPIRLRGWINVRNSSKPAWPIVLYAELRRGSHPVLNAKITARLVGPRGSGNSGQIHHLQLLDTGNGDPDITKNDGIYSRYVISAAMSGYYTAYLTAEDNGTSYVHDVDFDRAQNVLRIPTGSFRRETIIGTFLLTHTGDVYPPTRITDLRLKSLDSRAALAVITWSAPGDDFDHGQVYSYEFWKSHRLDCLTDFDLHHITEIYPMQPVTPKTVGSIQEAIINVHPFFNSTYIGVTALDDIGNRNLMSNVILIPRRRLHLENIPNSSMQVSASSSWIRRYQPVPEDECGPRCIRTSTITIIVACSCVFLVITIVVIIFICYVERRKDNDSRRKKKKKKNQSKDESERSALSSKTETEESATTPTAALTDGPPSVKEDSPPPIIEKMDEEKKSTIERDKPCKEKECSFLTPLLAYSLTRDTTRRSFSHESVKKCVCGCPPEDKAKIKSATCV